MSVPRGSIPIAITLGTFVAAPVYGVLFEWWHRADLTAGIVIGAIHGVTVGIVVLVQAIGRRTPSQRTAPLRPTVVYRVRRFATRVLYGAMMGLLYVVPR